MSNSPANLGGPGAILQMAPVNSAPPPAHAAPVVPAPAPVAAPAPAAVLAPARSAAPQQDPLSSITDLQFVFQDGQLLLQGVLNLASGTQIPISLPLQAGTDACPILDLDVQPIHLDVLGLVVDTSEIHVTVTAVPGPGNLLGNLLCGVAHLLDRPLTLAELLGVVSSLPDSGLNLSDVPPALSIQGFGVQDGQLVANGLLTLLGGLQLPVTIPLAPGTDIDQFLTVTIGPLHLDVLGLVVDTNEITVTVTAVPGPGNLLGNLLGDVAHLLDLGVPPQIIADLLNNLLPPPTV
jgi:hypothetical protein